MEIAETNEKKSEIDFYKLFQQTIEGTPPNIENAGNHIPENIEELGIHDPEKIFVAIAFRESGTENELNIYMEDPKELRKQIDHGYLHFLVEKSIRIA